MTWLTRYRHKGQWVLVSLSRDGEIQAKVYGSLGFNLIRGSTGRGGERALIQAIRELKKGGVLALTPDGPRGPSRKVQSGMLAMAQRSGAALVPIGTSCKPCLQLKSWDRFMVCLPFGRGVILHGEPLYLRADSSQEEVEAVRIQLEQEIDRLTLVADQKLGLDGRL